MGYNKKTSGKPVKFFNLKNGGKTDNPFFEIWENQGEKWEKVDKTEDVDGELRSVAIREKEDSDGEKYNLFELVLDDMDGSGERYIIHIPYTMLGRNIINTIAGATDEVKKVAIKVYVNNKGYKAASVLVNEEKVERLLGKEAQDKLIKIEDGVDSKGKKKKVYITTELEKALEKGLLEVKIANPKASGEDEPEEEEEVKAPETVAESQADDDLPF